MELADQEVRLENKIVQHDQREKYNSLIFLIFLIRFCDASGSEYAKRREGRSEELDVLSDAIGMLTSKIRLLKKYVGERTMTLERPIWLN